MDSTGARFVQAPADYFLTAHVPLAQVVGCLVLQVQVVGHGHSVRCPSPCVMTPFTQVPPHLHWLTTTAGRTVLMVTAASTATRAVMSGTMNGMRSRRLRTQQPYRSEVRQPLRRVAID